MNESPLQNVFRGDAIEVLDDDLGASRVLFKDLAVVESRANAKVVLKDLFNIASCEETLSGCDEPTKHRPKAKTATRHAGNRQRDDGLTKEVFTRLLSRANSMLLFVSFRVFSWTPIFGRLN